MSTSRLLRAGVAFALALGLVVVATPAPARSKPSVTCTSCYVIDDLGRVLWAKDAHARLPNASTTKMVTALEVIDEVEDPKSIVTVSSAAGSVGGGGLDLQPGDEMTVRNLLFAMLLSSSNEAAAALAEYVGGTQEAFVKAMNARARALGARNTHFANPHGLDATGHYSSAADLARIGFAVLAEPYLRQIVRTPETSIQTPRGPVMEQNRNLLLESYSGAVGIKTGRTLGAGNVLVGAARRGDHTLVAVAMHSTDATVDVTSMLDYGFACVRSLDRPRSTTVLGARTSVGSLIFDPSGAVGVVAAEPLTLELSGELGPVSYLLETKDVTLPLAPGDQIGTVAIRSQGSTIAEVDAVAADAVEEDGSNLIPNVLGALIEAVATAVSAVT